MSSIYPQKTPDKALLYRVILLFFFLNNLFAVLLPVSAQQAIELNSSSYPGGVPNGPTTASQTVNFRQNTTGTTFVALTNPVSVAASLSNQQYTGIPGNVGSGITFGSALGGSSNQNVTPDPVFKLMNAWGTPANGSFTSNPNGAAGTGITITQNYGFSLFTTVNQFVGTSGPPGLRAYYGNITFTFSRPVTDPVLHFGGVGARISSSPVFGITTEFELPAASGVTLTKLSGTAEFTVPGTNDKILNSTTVPQNACGSGAMCGSVRVNGTNLTSVTLRVYMRAQNTSFPSSFTGPYGDNWTVSVSLATYNLSGTVYNDANGLTDNTVNGTVTNAGGSLYALAVDALGNVQGTTPVSGTGTFSFTNLVKASYTVRLSTTPGTLGTAAPATSVPASWMHTGEYLGVGAGTDGSIDGNVGGAINTSDVTNFKLGIERSPTANDIFYQLSSVPAVNSVLALNGAIGSPFVGSTPIRPNGNDPEDGQLSNGDTIVINTLPANGTLLYNNTPVTAGQTITNLVPDLLAVMFSGAEHTSVSFTYSYKDAAAVPSPPATYAILWDMVLPVSLINFTATHQNGDDVLLRWQTASEDNNSGFTVQHSIDGEPWEVIGFVNGAGNSSALLSYNYLHSGVSKGIHHYRLLQKDTDGQSKLSHIRQVNISGKPTIQVYPNPATNILHIVSGQEDLKEMSLLEFTGSRILSRQFSRREYSLDISKVPAGVYLLVLQYKNKEFAYEKIIKQ